MTSQRWNYRYITSSWNHGSKDGDVEYMSTDTTRCGNRYDVLWYMSMGVCVVVLPVALGVKGYALRRVTHSEEWSNHSRGSDPQEYPEEILDPT